MILQHFSASHVILLMVTSPSWRRYHMLHSRGLVPIWLGLTCQFHGDWSQRMVATCGFTSESDFLWGGAASFFIFSISLQTWIASIQVRIYESLRRKKAILMILGCVSTYFLLLDYLSISFRLQSMATLKVINGKCGSSFVCNFYGQFNFKRASVFCGSVAL